MLYSLGHLNVLKSWRSDMGIVLWCLGCFVVSFLFGLFVGRFMKVGKGPDEPIAF